MTVRWDTTVHRKRELAHGTCHTGLTPKRRGRHVSDSTLRSNRARNVTGDWSFHKIRGWAYEAQKDAFFVLAMFQRVPVLCVKSA